MQEIWKTIEGYENYEVSNLGNIRNNNFHREGIIKEMKKIINKLGYSKIYLYKDGERKLVSVHRIVASAFIINYKNKPQVNHIDGNRENNNVINLEWSTSSENNLHKFAILGYKNNYILNHPDKGRFGEYARNSKKIYQKDLNGNIIKVWNAAMDVKRELNININSISACCNGKRNIAGGFKWCFV